MSNGREGTRGVDGTADGVLPISVVIPTFDRAALLREALASVARQTARFLETIVVDDGSADRTPEVVAASPTPVRYVRQSHLGVSAARNRGVRDARGAWVAFLDSDDVWEARALAAMWRAVADRPEVGLVAPRARVLRADGTVERRVRGKRSPGATFTTAGLIGPDTAGVLTPMVRRDLLLDVGGFDEGLDSAEDYDLWIRLSFRAPMIAIDEPVLLRRRHPGNLSADRGRNARAWLSILARLQSERPGFARDHRDALRRAFAKEHHRLGRALLRSGDPDDVAEGRRHVREALRRSPWFPRAWRTWLVARMRGGSR